ncbi:MAG: ABC transporter ATP-binding protein/permease [Candidatus Nomurabacteria bacterium]|jgi:ATP-binding cassette subfamily B protein|nr:ABC transporter ATP-binding protein/permease [Candidatus Nomurabacteria bacterium]
MKKSKIPKTIASRTLRYYAQEFKNQKVRLIMAVITGVAATFATYFATYFLSKLIDTIPTENTNLNQLLIQFVPLALGIFAINIFGDTIMRRVMMWTSWKSTLIGMHNLGNKCFSHLVNQTMNFHSNKFGGSLVSQTSKFVNAYDRLLSVFFWDVLQMVLTALLTFAFLAPLMGQYIATLLVLSVVFIAFATFSYRRMRQANEESAAAWNKFSGTLADNVTNIMTIKSYATEKVERSKIDKALNRFVDKDLTVARGVTLRGVVFSFIQSIMHLALIIYLVVMYGSSEITIGVMIMAISFTGFYLDNLWRFTHVMRDVNRVFGDAYDMTKILDETNAVVDAPDAKQLQVASGEVVFDNITFTHADVKESIFKDLSLEIPAGQRVGLVGRSGSGKTTITKLLLRFSDVESGAITIDGQNIKDVTQASLRRNIAYVPQETSLFHRTIAENIAYGRPNASRDEIIEAAKQANAWEFIKDLPKGLDTLTGERGVKLSGGQRQRVAIARAILKNAPILLLDEATASLDTESEKLIQEALSRLMKGRTAIIIAHRLSTVAELDRIILLDEGDIIEDDSHANLLAEGGIYAKLWNRQTGTIE